MQRFGFFHKKNSFFSQKKPITLNINLLRFFKKNKHSRSDQELLQAYQQSAQQEDFAELFSRYTHLVFGVCMKYLQDPDDASDAVMGIYEKLSGDILRHQVRHFSSWLHTSTRNYCLMQLRSQKFRDKQHQMWLLEQEYFMETEPLMHPIDDSGLHTTRLLKCLEQLRNEQKACIEMFYYQNKCYQEIALTLHLDEKKVKSHLQNGKRNLKICLES